jgi:hypothetical protein
VELGEQIDVALDDRGARDDPARVPVAQTDLETRARETVRDLEWLVAVDVSGERDPLSLPRRSLERLLEQLRRAA